VTANNAASVTTNTVTTNVVLASLAISKAVNRAYGDQWRRAHLHPHLRQHRVGNATNVVITDAIPVNTTFIPGSASGTGVTIEYSHNGGVTYDASSALPVTHIRFTRASLPAGTTNQTVSFQVRVDPGIADRR
jgi:hypothetical protein